jgi:Mg-chelatase subunit ChlD
MVQQKLEFKTQFGFPTLPAEQAVSSVSGFVRIKPVDWATPMSDHITLILDLSFSMRNNLAALRKSVEDIVARLKPHGDKCTIVGFAGEFTEFCRFVPVKKLQENLSEYLKDPLPSLGGQTNFRRGIEGGMQVLSELKESQESAEPVGNESFRWADHNHVAIFMTDGADYGNVPWEASEAYSKNGITLNTIALNTREISASVRERLMKMAKLGGGGFNFCLTVEEFERKVDLLLKMSLGAVCPPSILKVEVGVDVELLMVSLLEHIEQEPAGESELKSPTFVIPALRKDDRKIIYFRAKISTPVAAGHHKTILAFEQSPDMICDPELAFSSIPAAPMEAFKKAMNRGMNPDLRVYILLHGLESKLEKALQKAATMDDGIRIFQSEATEALEDCKRLIESDLVRNPRRDDLEKFVNNFLETLNKADTVADPRVYFSTLFAEMRTRR